MTAYQLALVAIAVLYTALSIAFVYRVDGPVRAAGGRRTWLRCLIRKGGRR